MHDVLICMTKYLNAIFGQGMAGYANRQGIYNVIRIYGRAKVDNVLPICC